MLMVGLTCLSVRDDILRRVSSLAVEQALTNIKKKIIACEQNDVNCHETRRQSPTLVDFRVNSTNFDASALLKNVSFSISLSAHSPPRRCCCSRWDSYMDFVVLCFVS